MTREHLINHIFEKYGVEPSQAYTINDNNACAFRHSGNNKMFASVCTVCGNQFGLDVDEIDIVEVHLTPEAYVFASGEKGVFPSFRASTTHRLMVVLGDDCDSELLEWLIEVSYTHTFPKTSSRRYKH